MCIRDRWDFRAKFQFWTAVSPLSEICSCLLENCKFLPPHLITHDATMAINTSHVLQTCYCFYDCGQMMSWCASRVAGWMTDWWIDWLIDWLIDWSRRTFSFAGPSAVFLRTSRTKRLPWTRLNAFCSIRTDSASSTLEISRNDSALYKCSLIIIIIIIYRSSISSQSFIRGRSIDQFIHSFIHWLTAVLCGCDSDAGQLMSLLSAGQTDDVVKQLLSWLHQAETYLSETQPVSGDLDTVSRLLDEHQVYSVSTSTLCCTSLSVLSLLCCNICL